MLVVGAKSMAKELLGLLIDNHDANNLNIAFFDNINKDIPPKLYDKFDVITNYQEAQEYLKINPKFTLGIGNPELRRKMFEKFKSLGGQFTSVISKQSIISDFGTTIGEGALIMPGVVITNDVKIGKGVLINIKTSISHDAEIGDFSEIACGVVIPGRCKLGEEVFIGSNATINPDIKIGAGAIIGSGAVVVKDVPENAVMIGNPARILKYSKDEG